MRFTLVDHIVELKPGVSITAVKTLSMAEEYLADHFPGFPVMPGVLMLEAMTQASAWLIRFSEDFAHSMVVLKQAENVKFRRFVEPGRTLQVTAKILNQTDRETQLRAHGAMDGRRIVAAQLVLQRYNLQEGNPARAATDAQIKRNMRDLFNLLYQGDPSGAESVLA